MAIYKLDKDSLALLEATSFARAGVLERFDLQRLLRANVGIIAPDTLVIAEEFGEWEESRRRIDLLGVDSDANLVVIELKRTEDGGYMELQALRYAAMVSMLSFTRAVDIFAKYLEKNGIDGDANDLLLEHLGWDSPQEDAFGSAVRIVLASADFSRELTTSVLWLNEQGLDIRCVRLKPYSHQDQILLDVQQVIPLPEAQEYQVNFREKQNAERKARIQHRDFTKYDVELGDTHFERLPKRRAVFHMVKFLCDQGADPETIISLFSWRKHAFRSAAGTLNSQDMERAIREQQLADGINPEPHRFFIDDNELIQANGRTYALNKMWGTRTVEALDLLIKTFPNRKISYKPSEH